MAQPTCRSSTSGTPLRLFSDFSVYDVDTLDYRNSRFSITPISGGQGADRVFFGEYTDAMKTVDNQIVAFGRPIATINGGVNGEPLVIQLADVPVSQGEIRRLIGGLVFATSEDAEVQPTRHFEAVFTDAHGASAPPVRFSVSVTETNDAPVLDTAPATVLPAIDEDAGPGILSVASLVAGRITDNDFASVQGIAVTGLHTQPTDGGIIHSTVGHGGMHSALCRSLPPVCCQPHPRP